MKKQYGICCGIDVHKRLIVACLIHGKDQEIRKFGSSTRELLSLADWLMQNSCQMSAMESTGSYWKPVYNIFEALGLPIIVVNAQHMKAVPGRKTDVNDAEWIADLLQHGLLRPSYIPDRQQRELRETLMLRKKCVQNLAAMVNRIQKVLEGANIKLGNSLSSIVGTSGRVFLQVLINGEPIDEAKIDELRASKKISGNLKASNAELVENLTGVLSPEQRRNLKIMLAIVDELILHIQELDENINDSMTEEQKKAVKAIKQVTGIGETSARNIIAVMGTDMNRFPTDSHLASWGGLCPGNNESAGKRKTGKTRKGNSLLKSTIILCAHSAVNVKDSFFSARFHRISLRRGSKRAYVAIAHSMIKAIYHILKYGIEFKDLGADYYNQFNRERKCNHYLKKLQSLGYDVSAVDTIPLPVT